MSECRQEASDLFEKGRDVVVREGFPRVAQLRRRASLELETRDGLFVRDEMLGQADVVACIEIHVPRQKRAPCTVHEFGRLYAQSLSSLVQTLLDSCIHSVMKATAHRKACPSLAPEARRDFDNIVRQSYRLGQFRSAVSTLCEVSDCLHERRRNLLATRGSFGEDIDMTMLKLQPQVMRRDFNRRPFLIQHNLVNHPLFELSSLAALGKRLPKQSVVLQRGDVKVSQNFENPLLTGLSVDETFDKLLEKQSVVLYKNVEADPLYREVIDTCLDEVRDQVDEIEPGMTERVGFIFVSSPKTVTPYHLDREINFLCQIRGNKTVRLWDQLDRDVVRQDELETFFAWHSLRATQFDERFQERAMAFEIKPGDGICQPSTAPHWVQNGNEISVSLSMTFRTNASNRRDFVYKANYGLRRLGLEPADFGEHRLVDSVKHRLFRAYSTGRTLLKR